MGEHDALLALLGRRPDGMSSDETGAVLDRISRRKLVLRDWPEPLDGMTFLHRAFGDLLRERGGTIDAADSIRRDLQRDDLSAVIILEGGAEVALDPTRWRGRDSRALYWSGKTTDPAGDLYLLDVSRNADGAKPHNLGETERNTYRKLILGMAMAKYQYRPGAAHQIGVTNIFNALKERGLDLADDTIRNKLKDALEVYDLAKDQTAKPNSV